MKVLVVVDMQRDFIDGALGTDEAVAIVDGVKRKIAEYERAKDMVIFTRDTHESDYLETQEGRKLPVPHCIKGSSGWEIPGDIFGEGHEVIDKTTFGSWKLADVLAMADGGKAPESIELVGLCTDICVISNALLIKARMPEVPISVDARCCAGVSPESHERALKAMETCQIDIKY